MPNLQTRRRPRPALRGFVAGLLTITLLWTMPAQAVKSQSLDEISATVTRYVKQSFADLGTISDVQVTNLDPRLNLPACAAPLEAFPANDQRRLGNATIGVRCEGERPWTLYVPVKITSEVTVLVSAKPLTRGTVLKESDLVPLPRDAAKLPHGYFVELDELVGLRLKRSLRAGEPTVPSTVSVPPMVERGQEVLLSASLGEIEVTMKGQALEDGVPGERIQVRNLSSRRVVEAEVIGRNRVRVPL